MVDITYTAKRKLVNTLDDIVTISVDLNQFDRSIDSKKSESKSIGGVIQSTQHYFTDQFSIETTPIDPANRAEFDEFIYSVMNNEPFLIDNIDEGITEVSVAMIGTPSRNRVTKAKVDYFTYSFNVREII